MATGNLRNLRLNDPLWRAVLRLARHQKTNATAQIRDLLDGWISAVARRDPEAAELDEVRTYLAMPRVLRLAADVADEEGPAADPPADVVDVVRERYTPRDLRRSA